MRTGSKRNGSSKLDPYGTHQAPAFLAIHEESKNDMALAPAKSRESLQFKRVTKQDSNANLLHTHKVNITSPFMNRGD